MTGNKKADIIIIAIIAACIGAGYLFGFYAWGEATYGGWFPPVVIAALASPIIFIPIGRGVVQGMREASRN